MTDRERIIQWIKSRPIPIAQMATRARISRGAIYRLMKQVDPSPRRNTVGQLIRVMECCEQKENRAP